MYGDHLLSPALHRFQSSEVNVQPTLCRIGVRVGKLVTGEKAVVAQRHLRFEVPGDPLWNQGIHIGVEGVLERKTVPHNPIEAFGPRVPLGRQGDGRIAVCVVHGAVDLAIEVLWSGGRAHSPRLPAAAISCEPLNSESESTAHRQSKQSLRESDKPYHFRIIMGTNRSVKHPHQTFQSPLIVARFGASLGSQSTRQDSILPQGSHTTVDRFQDRHSRTLNGRNRHRGDLFRPGFGAMGHRFEHHVVKNGPEPAGMAPLSKCLRCAVSG